jgi:hypothetical protein
VADNPGKIMAALKHPYANPNANISRTIKPLPIARSAFSHTIAATTLSTLSNIPKQTNQQPQPSPHQKPTSQPTSKGQKEAPKTHDKGNGKQQEWIGNLVVDC